VKEDEQGLSICYDILLALALYCGISIVTFLHFNNVEIHMCLSSFFFTSFGSDVRKLNHISPHKTAFRIVNKGNTEPVMFKSL